MSCERCIYEDEKFLWFEATHKFIKNPICISCKDGSQYRSHPYTYACTGCYEVIEGYSGKEFFEDLRKHFMNKHNYDLDKANMTARQRAREQCLTKQDLEMLKKHDEEMRKR